MLKVFTFDIEANGRRELYVGGKDKENSWVAEVTEVHCIVIRCKLTKKVWRYVSNPTVVEHCDGSLIDGWNYLMTALLLIAHNGIDYDMAVLRRLVAPKDHDERDEPPLVDTLVWSRFLYPDMQSHPNLRWMKGTSGGGPNALEVWGRRLKCLKGSFKGPWDRLTQVMLDYCVQDTLVGEKIYDFLLPKMLMWKGQSRLEHAFSRIISGQSCNGISFDHESAEVFWKHLVGEKARLSDALTKSFPFLTEEMKTPMYWQLHASNDDGMLVIRESTKSEVRKAIKKAGLPIGKAMKMVKPGPLKVREIWFNPGSDMQVADRLKELYSWKPTRFTDGGKPQVNEDVLAGLDYPEAALINQWRLTEKRITMLRDWMVRSTHSRDGRIHGSVNTNGTPTARCTHSQPNLTQVTKVISGDDGPIAGIDGRYGLESRSLFIPRPGWVQVGADASGLELRMLANRTMPYDGGEYAKILLEGDIHTHNMKQIPLLQTRPQSKEIFYAGIYGCGDEKGGKVIMFHKSLTQAQRRVYAGRSPEIVGKEFKQQLNEGCPALGKAIARAKRWSKEKGYLILLDGRRAPCRSEHSALNTQLQGDGQVICKLSCILAFNRLCKEFGPPSIGIGSPGRWSYMLNVHDETQVECEKKIAKRVGTIMAWAYGRAGAKLRCKIETPGDFKVGANWAECH